ncbi:unnamed protein product, partial [Vitis vinifera]
MEESEPPPPLHAGSTKWSHSWKQLGFIVFLPTLLITINNMKMKEKFGITLQKAQPLYAAPIHEVLSLKDNDIQIATLLYGLWELLLKPLYK